MYKYVYYVVLNYKIYFTNCTNQKWFAKCEVVKIVVIGPSCFSCIINYLIDAGGYYPWHSCTKNELLSLLLALAHEDVTYVDCNDHSKIF